MSEHEHNVFVASLPFSLTEDDLYNIFQEYGTVESAKIITHRDTGTSRGFGFVKFTSKEDAKAAIEGGNGSQIQGRNIYCDAAKPQSDGGGQKGGYGWEQRSGGGSGYGDGQDQDKIIEMEEKSSPTKN